MLLFNHDMKVINDKEFLLLLDDNISRTPEFKYECCQRFDSLAKALDTAPNHGIVSIPYVNLCR